MTRTNMFALLTTVLLAACGGGGVDKPTVATGTKLVDLTADQAGDLCDYVSELEGGYGYSKMCDSEITLHVKADRATCVASYDTLSTTCTATVANAEACAEAVQDDLCKLLTAPECAFALSCAGG